MTYLVVLDAAAPAMDPDDLVAAARRRWPDCGPGVDLAALDRSRVVEWEARTSAGAVVDVAVRDGFDCFFLDGSPQACAEVIAWIRTLVDDQVGLTVCDDGYTFDVGLEPGATPAWIEQQL